MLQSKYHPKDGEPIELIEGEWVHVCCKCNTKHRVVVKKKGKKWIMAWYLKNPQKK